MVDKMNRQEYSSWIRETRGKISQEEFGRKLCHFKNEKDIKICSGYHRNEVANWEKGKNLPTNLETFISIALLDFDSRNQREEKDNGYRNLRFQYVQDKMEKFLRQKLYCRCIHDALLIQVCRDVINFEELLDMEPRLEKIIQDIDKEMKQEKKKYALQKKTNTIQKKMFQITSKEKIKEIVEELKIFFYTGARTFGERMKECFKKRQRYIEEISFEEAVRIYAPNYRESYGRIFNSSSITRQWIIDLCVHLRFNRTELQTILGNAYLVPLSDHLEDEEYYYRDQKQLPIGSTSWYQYMEKNYRNEFPAHFEDFFSLELIEKYKIAILLNIFISNMLYKENLVPIDYLLESFTKYDYGQAALKAVEQVVKDMDQSFDDPWEVIEKLTDTLKAKINPWFTYLFSGSDRLESDAAKKVYKNYCEESKNYYLLPKQMIRGFAEDFELTKMRCFAALLYTVFTGQYYIGTISNADLKKIKAQFENRVAGWRTIYGFINQFLITFLGNQPLCKNNEGYFCIINQKKTGNFNMREVTIDIWESFRMLICTK